MLEAVKEITGNKHKSNRTNEFNEFNEVSKPNTSIESNNVVSEEEIIKSKNSYYESVMDRFCEVFQVYVYEDTQWFKLSYLCCKYNLVLPVELITDEIMYKICLLAITIDYFSNSSKSGNAEFRQEVENTLNI